jgi:endonuclease YncB( thermonuclease family)
VEWDKKDRYQRYVGKEWINGKDANLEQIRAGMAWHFKRYEREQSPEDRRTYAKAEKRARAQRIGLWQEEALAPWVWRKQKK